MSNLGSGGPPERVPSTPGNLDISREDIDRAERRELGGGTDTVVYATELDGRSSTRLAVKVADPDGTMDAAQFDRIVGEATTWEQLTADDESRSGEIERRDHIVDIVDWGKEPLPWLALEFMDGGSLRDVLDEGDGQLPLDQALWVGARVCDGVLHAHRHGVVHRDLKPSNILFRKPSRGWLFPKVGDWGLARVMLETDTRRGLTPAYAAPEQFHPDQYGTPGPETDIYQIGVLVYELVTGALPFDGTAPEISEAKTSEEPTPPSEVAGVPEAVDDILLPALQREKAARYEDIVYLRDELDALFEHHHGETSSVGPTASTPGGAASAAPVTDTASTDETGETDVEREFEDTDGTGNQSSPDTDGSSGGGTESTPDVSDDAMGPLSGGDSRKADRPSMQSWDEYREELEQRKQGLYSTLPRFLRGLFYAELTAELDRAESRREEIGSEIDETKTEARRLLQQLEDELYDAGVFGEQLSEDTLERQWEVEDIRARLDTLLDEHRAYLTTDEQETAADLRERLADHEAYLGAKRRLDKTVRSLRSELDDIEHRIDETLDGECLLADDRKRDLVSDLDAVSQLLRTSRLQLDIDALTTQDRKQFKPLVERERTLRERVEQYNHDLVQCRYSDEMDAATVLRDRTDEAIAAYRSDDTEAPGPPVDYLASLEERLDALEAILDSRQTEFLSADQHDRMKQLHDELASNCALLDTKATLETRLPDVRSEIDAVRSTVEETLDGRTYLSEDDREQLEGRLGDIRGNLTALEKREAFDRLTDADRRRTATYHERLDDLESEVEEYNPTLVEQHYERHSEAATRVWTEIDETIAPHRANGTPLPESAEAYTGRLDRAVQALSTFLDRPQTRHLSGEQRNHIERLRDEFREQRSYIERKSAFDTRLAEVRTAIADLEVNVDDHLDMETYLTTPARNSLRERIECIHSRLDGIENDGLLDVVSDADVERFEGCRPALDDLEAELEAYNERFVEQQCERLGTLGPDGQSLNENQRRAVVRDDTHNRVIAGPGTGKTFSLLCRINYLVENGIPPDEILALSFNRHTSTELERRLVRQFDVSGVDVRTLHSYGKELVDQAYPGEILLTGQTRLREVGSAIRRLRDTDPAVATHYETFRELLREKQVSSEHKPRKDLYNSLVYSSGKTLRGETIELDDDESKRALTTIADTLFEHQVDYRYRAYASWVSPPDGNPYIPDFILPEHDVCIDYSPSEDAQNERASYNRKRPARVLRQFYTETDRTLVTLHGGDIDLESLDSHLQFKLGEAGVSTGASLEERELIDSAYEHNVLWRDIEKRVAEFVKKAKTNQREPAQCLDNLDEEENPMLYHFSHLATAVLEAYRRTFDEYGAYDYADMVLRATDILERGHADDSMAFRHVLVDEFQDLNLAQIELLRAILEHGDETHLFTVGDDWQSIYGFRGARPEFFVDFEDRFAPATTTRLDTNYRCPPSVVQASNALMSESDIETTKSLEAAASNATTTPTVHVVPGKDGYPYETNALTRVVELVLESIREEGRSPGEILVLTRNEEGSPFIPRIGSALQDRDVPTDGYDGVTVTTAHGAKGSEAEHVILVNAVRGRDDGFPPVEKEGSLTQLVDAGEESHVAEERRLFYVALTRAEERLDIQTRASWQSRFLDPLEEHVTCEHVPIDCTRDRVSVTGTVDNPKEVHSVRQIGTLEVDGYLLSYAIPNYATDVPLLQGGRTYRIENVQIGKYDGNPQLRVDGDVNVHPL